MPLPRRSRLALAAALGLGSCMLLALAWPHRAAPRPDTAVIQVSQEPDTLDPFVSPMTSTSSLAALFYAGLVSLDDHGRWIPDLAERVPSAENGDVTMDGAGMRVRYRLRPGLRWSDGAPLTAQDVEATWKLLTDKRFPALSLAGYDQIARIEAPDDRTAVVVYKAPYAPYLELFPFVLPAHVVAQAPSEKAAWNRQPVGAGPYTLERWVSGDRLVCKANPRYFRGKPGIATLEVRFVPQENTAFSLWRAGELDLLQAAPPTQFEAMQREDARRVTLTPTTSWEHLLFNLEQPALKEPAVRRAIAHLVDRHQLNSVAYGGVFLPAWSELPTFSWAYDSAVENRYPYDPAQAERELEAAGWRKGPDGVRHKGAQSLSFTLLTTSDKPSRQLAAEIWRKQWRQAGIALEIDRQPGSAVFGSAASGGRLASGRFDLALIASVSRPDPDASFRWRSDQVPPAGQNRARYRSKQVDTWLAEGVRTIPPARRKPIYAKLAERLSTDLPVLPLLYWVEIDAPGPRLEGFRPNPTLRGNLWNVWEWRLRPAS